MRSRRGCAIRISVPNPMLSFAQSGLRRLRGLTLPAPVALAAPVPPAGSAAGRSDASPVSAAAPVAVPLTAAALVVPAGSARFADPAESAGERSAAAVRSAFEASACADSFGSADGFGCADSFGGADSPVGDAAGSDWGVGPSACVVAVTDVRSRLGLVTVAADAFRVARSPRREVEVAGGAAPDAAASADRRPGVTDVSGFSETLDSTGVAVGRSWTCADPARRAPASSPVVRAPVPMAPSDEAGEPMNPR